MAKCFFDRRRTLPRDDCVMNITIDDHFLPLAKLSIARWVACYAKGYGYASSLRWYLWDWPLEPRSIQCSGTGITWINCGMWCVRACPYGKSTWNNVCEKQMCCSDMCSRVKLCVGIVSKCKRKLCKQRQDTKLKFIAQCCRLTIYGYILRSNRLQ